MKQNVNRGYRVRIYPTEVQSNKIEHTFGCVRHIWNYSLMERFSILELYGDYPELLTSHKYKLQKDWKRDFEFYSLVDSQALNSEQQIVNQTFKHWLQGICKKPRYKSKKNDRKSYTTHTTNNNIRIEGNMIKLPKVGWVKLKKQRKIMPDDAIIKAATVSKTPSGKYFVSLRLEYSQEESQIDRDALRTIGLDFSINDFYVDSNGKKANYPYYFHQSLEKLSKLQRKLSKKIRKSNSYNKLRLKIAKLHEKISNQRNDFLHKESRYLVNNNDIISTETLDLTGMTKNRYFSKKVTDISYNRFLSYLKYKCEETGKVFHQVDKYYASSKTCSVCGKKKKTLPLSQRVYSCECGTVINRDLNAALNLATKGMISYLTNYIEDRTASIAW